MQDEVIIDIENTQESGDLISRQAVLDAIEGLKKIHFDRVVVLNKVRDRVLELPFVNPQEPKTGWIPVSERLPEKSDRYLAYIVNRKDDKLQYIMTCDYLVDGYWNWFPDAESASDNVIAWMPLPEPYKAD